MYYEDSLEPPPEPARPAHVPEKFWDPATNSVRVDSLLRAYLDLERRMSGMIRVPGDNCSRDEIIAFHRALGVPDTPDGYCIEQRHEMLTPDPEVNARLHEAGFTPRQAQLVYDLAFERVVPMLEQMREEFEEKLELERLHAQFGGAERFATTARQLSAWGKANLAPDVYAALSATPQGIMAMRRMMESGEPGLGRTAAVAEEPLSEQQLKQMMQDPRYWKKKDPAFIDRVSAGFRRLYGDEG